MPQNETDNDCFRLDCIENTISENNTLKQNYGNKPFLGHDSELVELQNDIIKDICEEKSNSTHI